MCSNLELYNKVRSVPNEALKPIMGGKLKGKSDINPMWRIKTLTEQFGPCGKGWKPEIVKTWIDDGAAGEKVVNIILNLYVKYPGETDWSAPILGIGGNTIIQTEKGQLVTNDEAYKMAYTDALSVACKALGFAADVYFEKDKTKYGELGVADSVGQPQGERSKTVQAVDAAVEEERRKKQEKTKARKIQELIEGTGIQAEEITQWIKNNLGAAKKVNDLTDEEFNKLYTALKRAIESNVA